MSLVEQRALNSIKSIQGLIAGVQLECDALRRELQGVQLETRTKRVEVRKLLEAHAEHVARVPRVSCYPSEQVINAYGNVKEYRAERALLRGELHRLREGEWWGDDEV